MNISCKLNYVKKIKKIKILSFYVILSLGDKL